MIVWLDVNGGLGAGFASWRCAPSRRWTAVLPTAHCPTAHCARQGQGSVTKLAAVQPAGGRPIPREGLPLCNLLAFRIVLGASATERGSR